MILLESKLVSLESVSNWQPDDAPPPPEYLQGINVSPRAQIVPWFAHFNILQRCALVTGIYNIADMGSPGPGVCIMLKHLFTESLWV